MDFICIGAQKAGTTWLYNRLDELDEVNMLPVKEVHYFDRSVNYPSPSLLSQNNKISRIRNKNWRKYFLNDIIPDLKKTNIRSLLWKLRFYLSSYNDTWYLNLGKSQHKITGDITPSYSILEEEDVQKIFKLLPEVKIIFLIRNPIDRAWSSYKYSKRNNPESLLHVEPIEIVNFLNDKARESRSDYLNTLKVFGKFTSHQNILIGFYDAIIKNPESLLKSICSFLGMQNKVDFSQIDLNRKDNVSTSLAMPEQIHTSLNEKYKNAIDLMSLSIGSYCKLWNGIQDSEEELISAKLLSDCDFSLINTKQNLS